MNGMTALWQSVFGDEEGFICRFLAELDAPALSVSHEEAGRIVAAAHGVKGLSLCRPGAVPLRADYTYAVATLPEFRGRGLGRNLSFARNEKSFADGAALTVLVPAEPGLFAWYEAMGFSSAFSCREAAFTAEGTPLKVERLSANAYLAARETALAQTVHLAFSSEFLRFFEESGGEFLHFSGNASGLAALERKGETLLLRELLPACGTAETAAAGLAAALGASHGVLRCPTDWPGTEALPRRDFAMAAFASADAVPLQDAYFGFALD